MGDVSTAGHQQQKQSTMSLSAQAATLPIYSPDTYEALLPAPEGGDTYVAHKQALLRQIN